MLSQRCGRASCGFSRRCRTARRSNICDRNCKRSPTTNPGARCGGAPPGPAPCLGNQNGFHDWSPFEPGLRFDRRTIAGPRPALLLISTCDRTSRNQGAPGDVAKRCSGHAASWLCSISLRIAAQPAQGGPLKAERSKVAAWRSRIHNSTGNPGLHAPYRTKNARTPYPTATTKFLASRTGLPDDTPLRDVAARRVGDTCWTAREAYPGGGGTLADGAGNPASATGCRPYGCVGNAGIGVAATAGAGVPSLDASSILAGEAGGPAGIGG